MLPSKLNYPEFVPDQLLTSEHLNQLFEYLEEQGRLTRTNLIGIGIVCGLEVKTSADGTSIIITKGCGVTSEGYLVTVPETTYTKYKEFNAVQELLYDKFVDSSRTQRFHIDELKQAAVEEGTTALSSTFLKDKIVMLFVEILEESSKNCNPNSCDDKGVNVTVNFRPLLIDKADAESLFNGSGTGNKSYQNLAELKMRRFDVLATPLADTSAVFEAYRKVLNNTFIINVEKLLNDAYTTFSPLLLDIYPSTPFNGLANNFKFLYDDSITEDQLINLQYYYDLFSDILLAYDELRKVGLHAISLCCPDSNLFPRHLMLDLAIPDASKTGSSYRHYFIPSPILNCNYQLTKNLRALFTRIVLLIEKFAVPSSVMSIANRRTQRVDTSIRITPSKFGDIPLSEKSIPFYYKVAEGPYQLYKYWNYEKSNVGKENRILSYHSKTYNATDDDIINPLLYDLEPNNFLRIEGHIGQHYQQAMQRIITLRNQYRLPFEVIALSADVKSLRNQIRELSARAGSGSLRDLDDTDSKCQFKDLESLYDTLSAELTCMLCKEMKYFYNLPGSGQLPAPSSTIPQVSLLKKCDPNFRFTANTFGHQFEVFYNSIKNQAYIGADVFLGNVFNAAGTTNNGNNNIGLALLYYIEKLAESITSNLSNFDLATFNIRHQDLLRIAEHIKAMFGSVNTDNRNFTEDVIDHLDALIYACKSAQFSTLYRDYLSRWLYVLMLQKFAFFIKSHPGIQHKAGVTIGGTFILVYHEEVAEEEPPLSRGTVGAEASTSRIRTNFSSATKAKVSNEAIRDLVSESSMVNNSAFTAKQKETIRDLFQGREVDSTIEELIADISDGTVIADFYLPYLCYSDCPPINFILGGSEPPAEDVTIDVKEKEYCSGDKKAHEVVVSPEGGTISGEGITTSTAGKTTFSPSKVDLQSQTQKTITLSYTREGKTATVEVLIYQKPVAAFEAQEGRVPTHIIFTNFSDFAGKFEWDFGDGQKSEEENPQHRYASEGTFTVTLKVSNGICSETATQTIDVKNPAIKICLPVSGIIDAFRKLESLNPRLFKVFRESYGPYSDIESFFKEFESIAGDDVQKHIDFFASRQINVVLERWLNELVEFVLNSDLQLIATGLYQVLVNLAMYISCIQAEDADKAKVPMAGVFSLIFKHVNAFKSALNSEIVKDFVMKMLQDLLAEEKRIKDNKEDITKPVYLKLIQELIELIKSFNL